MNCGRVVVPDFPSGRWTPAPIEPKGVAARGLRKIKLLAAAWPRKLLEEMLPA